MSNNHADNLVSIKECIEIIRELSNYYDGFNSRNEIYGFLRGSLYGLSKAIKAIDKAMSES